MSTSLRSLIVMSLVLNGLLLQSSFGKEKKSKEHHNDESPKVMHFGITKKDLPPAVLKSIQKLVEGNKQSYCKVVKGHSDGNDLQNIEKKNEKPARENDITYMVETIEHDNLVFYFFNTKGKLLERNVQEVIGGGSPEQDENLRDKPENPKKK